jgi:hypothetical protein
LLETLAAMSCFNASAGRSTSPDPKTTAGSIRESASVLTALAPKKESGCWCCEVSGGIQGLQPHFDGLGFHKSEPKNSKDVER